MALVEEIQTTSPVVRALKDITAGAVGGVAQVLIGQPFDTVKVRLQTQDPKNPIYNGFVDAVNKIKKQEGFAGFYKGTLTPLIGVGACVSIQFFTLEYMKRMFAASNAKAGQINPENLSLKQLFIAGAMSGVTNSVVAGPVEHIRIRLQTQSGTGPGSFTGPVDAIRKIYGQAGIAGLYKAQVTTIVREFFGYGCYFAAYEYLVQRHLNNHGLSKRSDLPPVWAMMYGAAAGYALWLSIFPIDTIKSKLQVDSLDPTKAKYKGALDCVRKTLASEGVKGLYRGLVPCLIRAFPTNAGTFAAFELAMNFLGR